MWRWIANLILRNRFIILGVITLVTIFLGYKAFTSLELDNKYGLALPKNSQTTETYMEFKKMFGEDGGTLVLALETDSLYEVKNYNLWRELGNKIYELSLGVNSVVSESTIPFTNNIWNIRNNKEKRQFEIPSDIDKVSQELSKSQEGIDEIEQKLKQNPFFKDLIYSKENDVSLMLIGIDESYLSNKDSCNLVLEIENLAKSYEKDLGEIHFSGLPYIRVVLAKRVQKEMYLFIGLSILMTSILLYLFFRSFKVVAICLTVVSIAVIWAMGNIAFFGWKLSFLMALIPPLMIVIGVPNCIFLMTKFHQEIKHHGNKTKALSRVIQKIGTATFLTNLSTSLGFLTFIFTNSERLIEFGLAASMNIMLVFVISICILPIFLSLQDAPKKRHLKHLDRKIATGLIKGLLHLTQKHRNYVYLATSVILIVSFYGMMKIESTGNLTGDLPEKDQIKKDLKFLEQKFGGSIPFEIMITYPGNQWWKRQTLSKVEHVQESLTKDGDFSKSISVVEMVKWINMCYYDNDSSKFELNNGNRFVQRDLLKYVKDFIQRSDNGNFSINELIDTNKRVIRVRTQMKDLGSYEVIEKVKSIEDTLERILNPERQQLEVYFNGLQNDISYIDSVNNTFPYVYNDFRDIQFNSDELKEKFEENPSFRDSIYHLSDFSSNFRQAIDQNYFSFQLTGTSVVASEGTRYLVKNLISSLIFAIIFIAVLMSILFRSWRMVLVSMIPNLIPLIITAGIMGYLGIPLKPSTLLVFSIAFGISVDDTIHYLAKYRQELKTQKWNERECVLLAIKEAGIGMFYTSIVLFFGFFVFTFSQFGGTQALGYLVSFTLISAMLCNLIILPSLLLTLNKWLISKSFKEPYFETFDEESDIEWEELTFDSDEKNNIEE